MNTPSLSTRPFLALLVLTTALVASCQSTTNEARLADTAAPVYTGHIQLSIAHPFNVKREDYEILLSVPVDVANMAVCEVKKTEPCAVGSPAYFKTKILYATAQRRYFKADASALLEDGLVLKFVSLDAKATAVDTRVVQFKWLGAPKTATVAATTPPAATAGQTSTVADPGATNANGNINAAGVDPNATADDAQNTQDDGAGAQGGGW
jgi:hypothetical protein